MSSEVSVARVLPSAPNPLITQFRLVTSGAWHLGVVVRRTFVLVDGRNWRSADTEDAPDADELTPWKPNTDVVIRGHVYAPRGPTSEVQASIHVGDIHRTIRATGDRFVQTVQGGAASFSKPIPFERIPLTFGRSYGGFDRGAYEIAGDIMGDLAVEAGADLEVVSRFAYPRNQQGMGFYVGVSPERLRGAPVPNLDDPLDPVTPERLIRASARDWLDAPGPAALDWAPPTTFPRCLHFGLSIAHSPSTHPIREMGFGDLEKSDLDAGKEFSGILDPRALSGACSGMARTRLRGGEPVRMVALHPSISDLNTVVPREQIAVSIRPPGCPSIELESELHSAVFDVDRDRLALTWGAKLEVAGRYPDHELALVTAEVRAR